MPQLTLDVPSGVAVRVFDAIAERKGYNPATDGTKAAFCKKAIIQMIMNEVRAHERELAAKTAGDVADTAVETQIVIT